MGDLGEKKKHLIQTAAESAGDEAPQKEEEEEKEEEGKVTFIPITEDQLELKVIPSEDFHNSLTDLSRANSNLSELRAQRDSLIEKLESSLQVHKFSVQRVDELEALKKKLRHRDMILENAKVSLQEKSEDLAIAKDKFLSSARSLLTAAKSLVAAESRLQDECRLLQEEGHGRLSHLKNMLSARRRLMVAQIASIYPVLPCSAPNASSQQMRVGNTLPQHTDSSTKESQCSDKVDTLPMTIGGLHVVAPLNNKPGLYSDSITHESSATALGYVAHALSLLAAYLDMPLRYPLRIGSSRSYIQDYAPAVEANSMEGTNGAAPNLGGNRKTVMEFPLFSEGQDSTRSAYAVFLLNKDLEQVLNYLGAESVGPRHTLPNLNKIIQLVCSGAGSIA